MSLAYQMDLLLKIKASGILGMAAIDQEDQGRHIALRRRCERNATSGFKVNGSYLFAFPQIRDGGTAVRRCHPIGDAAAGAAAVEAKYEAGLLRRPAMNERIHTQRPVQPDEARLDTFKVGETRPPHERSVTKHPKIFIGGRLRKVHERRSWVWQGGFANSKRGAAQVSFEHRDGSEEMA
jgi:hypothetical protein